MINWSVFGTWTRRNKCRSLTIITVSFITRSLTRMGLVWPPVRLIGRLSCLISGRRGWFNIMTLIMTLFWSSPFTRRGSTLWVAQLMLLSRYGTWGREDSLIHCMDIMVLLPVHVFHIMGTIFVVGEMIAWCFCGKVILWIVEMRNFRLRVLKVYKNLIKNQR